MNLNNQISGCRDCLLSVRKLAEMLKTRGIAAKIVKKYLCNTAAIAAIAAKS
jgi:hypothetical protein